MCNFNQQIRTIVFILLDFAFYFPITIGEGVSAGETAGCFTTSSVTLRATCLQDKHFPQGEAFGPINLRSLIVSLWYNVSRASMPDSKRSRMSLGLEPSLRAGSLYAYSIMKYGTNRIQSLFPLKSLCLSGMLLTAYLLKNAVESGEIGCKIHQPLPFA